MIELKICHLLDETINICSVLFRWYNPIPVKIELGYQRLCIIKVVKMVNSDPTLHNLYICCTIPGDQDPRIVFMRYRESRADSQYLEV
ncbi:unnamed protein product [Moneuplotes crassus]|uniref:Uncharacterized protein n=1 Tax=Euplotes crassus TaxID=5936 RepID=A0AAD1UNX4_EUPCR|nr:unnamed protein product [Moneuplotes crassus]